MNMMENLLSDKLFQFTYFLEGAANITAFNAGNMVVSKLNKGNNNEK